MLIINNLRKRLSLSKKKGDINYPLVILIVAVLGIALLVIAKTWDVSIGTALKAIIDGAIAKIKTTTGF